MKTTKLFLLIVIFTLLSQPMDVLAQTTHDVTVGNNFFSPANLTIQVGDTVRWTNAADGGPPHDVTGSGFASVTAESFTFQHTFTQPGTFNYVCTVHSSMTGTITVQGGGGGAADLSLTEISVNNNITYQAGGAIAIDTEVTNVGSASSAAFTVNFYVSNNSQISAGDTLLGSSNRPALGQGNDDNFTANLNLPGNLAQGNYFIGGIINIDDANNANNTNLEDEAIVVQGGGGGGFSLNPGHNGNWWTGPERNGEGVQIEVSDNGAGGLVLVATKYSYNSLGQPIFLLAVGQVVNGEAAVDVFIYEGPMWGPGFDPADLVETQWGTGLFTSSSCDAISMVLTPNATFVGMGYSELGAELIRLTISAIPCPIP
jgi:plastocyanin